jgi:hypothetical protein
MGVPWHPTKMEAQAAKAGGAAAAAATHTHTRSFKDFHTHHWQVYAPDTICKRPIKKNKKAPGREKTETAPRKNSLGPTIRWQGRRKELRVEGAPWLGQAPLSGQLPTGRQGAYRAP